MLLFITGGAGVGKSALLKVLFQAATNVSNTMIDQGDFHKPKAMVMAMTGCTARNVGGKTVHSALGLGWGTNTEASAFSRTLQEQRVQWQYVDTVFIDEISLISTDTLSRINHALNNIFGTHDVARFGGKHVIFLGDLYQLPPVTGRMIFLPPKAPANTTKTPPPINPFKAMAEAATPLTAGFKLYELTEIMRQKDAVPFANLLARLRRGPSHLTEEDRVVLRSRTQVQPFPNDIYVSWFNKDVDAWNAKAYSAWPGSGQELVAKDRARRAGAKGQIPPSEAHMLLDKAKHMRTTDTKLPHTIRLKVGMPTFMTTNVDVEDGLTNGAGGVVKYFTHGATDVTIVWVQFDDATAGQCLRTRAGFIYRQNPAVNSGWIPVQRWNRS